MLLNQLKKRKHCMIKEIEDQTKVNNLSTSNNPLTITECFDTSEPKDFINNQENTQQNTGLPELSAENYWSNTSAQISTHYPPHCEIENMITNNDDSPALLTIDLPSTSRQVSTFLSPSNKSTVYSECYDTDDNLPEISAENCIPCSSKQQPKFKRQSNSSSFPLPGFNNDFKSILKRKYSEYGTKECDKSPIPEKIKTTNIQPRSFNIDTFVNYGELSNRETPTMKKWLPRSTQLKHIYNPPPVLQKEFQLLGQEQFANMSTFYSAQPKIIYDTSPVLPKEKPTSINNYEIRRTSLILSSHIPKNEEKDES